MEKNIEIASLYDSYKQLLTKKMQEVFELYYYSDLSLREIGENKGISYQGARDTIKKVEKQVMEYEEKLGLNSLKQKIDNCLKYIKELENMDLQVKHIKKILEDKN